MTDVQDKINALWNGAAKEYDATPRHGILDPWEEAAWSAALRPLLPPAPADVLDVGTGTGFLAMLIAGLGYRVRGVDLAEEMLAMARRKAGASGLDVTFERGDAIAPPGDPESCDAIVSRHLFWTLTDPARALESWRRLLRPGGRLVIIDGLWSQDPDSRLGDLADSLPVTSMTSLNQVCDLVRAAGFSGVSAAPLEEIERVERELHGEPDQEPRYVVTASRPV